MSNNNQLPEEICVEAAHALALWWWFSMIIGVVAVARMAGAATVLR